MKIAILNSSPRKNGNTSHLVNALSEGAMDAGHEVNILNIGNMHIDPCYNCGYCRKEGTGECCRKDDMQEIYPYIKDSDMIIFASPIYYWGITGQLQSAITRFYAFLKPKAKKYALVLSSGAENVYDAAVYQYKQMLNYFEGEDLGIKTFSGNDQQSEANLSMMREFGRSLK